MRQILIGWMGFSDKQAFEVDDVETEGVGPIGAALKWRRYDTAYILCNDALYPIQKEYQTWLQQLSSDTHLTIVHADVMDPTDYSAIYREAIATAMRASQCSEPYQITFQTSSGTAHMGVVWLLLQKRFNAKLLKSSKEHGVMEIDFPFNLTATLIEKGSSVEGSEAASLIYESRIMSELVEQIITVAPLSRPVLIEGESGTGKELIAEKLYEQRSHSLTGKFIPVNCGAIAKNLVESELFGHVKGAFTGAVRDKKGKIEQAHNGVLFLDEIGEMPLDVQVKLLRVLQDKAVIRVGDESGNAINVNFRLVAATNRNLMEEVSKGNFREDLYYRIAVITVRTPPLRERGSSDVRLISEHYMESINREFSEIPGYASKTISDEAYDLLYQYRWPGNIRELSNVLYRASIWRPESPVITPDEINRAMGSHGSNLSSGEQILHRLDHENTVVLEDILDEVRRHYYEAALAKCRGNISQASTMLGCNSRPQFQIKKLGIDVDQYRPLP